MKRLNLKLVIILGVSTLCLCLGLYFGHAMQVQNGSVNLKRDAESLVQEGKRREALQKYQLYLKQNDGDAVAWAATGKLAVEIFDNSGTEAMDFAAYSNLYQQARFVMASAIRHNTDNAELRRQFAELLMKGGLYADAIEHLQWLSNPDRAKHDSKIDVMLATCYEMREFFAPDPKNPGKSAMEVYARLIGYDLKGQSFAKEKKATEPDEVSAQLSAYIGLVRVMRERLNIKQPKQADAVMSQLVTTYPDSYDAHLARAKYLQFYTEKDDKERAKVADSELATAVKMAPEAANVILAAAEIDWSERHPENRDAGKCEKLLNHGLELFPKNVEMYRQLARLKVDQGKIAEARKLIEQGLSPKVLPRDPNLMQYLVEIQIREGDLKAARTTIKELSTIPTIRKPWLDLVNARILYADKQWLPASKEFERLSRELEGKAPEQAIEALMFASRCYQQLGEFDKQLVACRKILTAKPNDLDAQLGIATALMATGKSEMARHEYEKLPAALQAKNLSSLQSPLVWRPLFQFLIADQMKLPPEKRDWTKVDHVVDSLENSLKKSQTVSPEEFAAAKSEVEWRKGDLDGAAKTLKDAIKKTPESPELWASLARVILEKDGDKGVSAALKLLDDAPKAIHDSVVLRIVRAGLIAQGSLTGHEDQESVRASISRLDAGSNELPAADRSRLWSGLGNALYTIRDLDGALSYWTKVADADHDNVSVRMLMFDVASSRGDDAVMSRILDDMRRIMGNDSADANYVQAARTATLIRKAVNQRASSVTAVALEPQEAQELKTARKLLERVKKERPEWYEVPRAMADVELLDGNPVAAVECLKQALKLGPPDPLTVQAAVKLLMETGHREEIASIIDLVGKDQMKRSNLTRFVAQSRADSGDYDEAIETAKATVKPDDVFGTMWLAQLYVKAGKLNDAEECFRRAVKIKPDLPEPWVGLVETLIANKKGADASAVLMRARKELPDDQVNFVLGEGYELIGEDVLAEQYLHAAVDANPKDILAHKQLALFLMRKRRGEEARKEIMTVLHAAQDNPQGKADVLWGRRTLAEILAATGDNEDFKRAKALLVANVKLNDAGSEDQLKLANLLATRGDEPASLREAQELFESMKTHLSVREKMTLATIHDLLGNKTLARNEMFELVSQATTPDAALLRAYVEMLLRHNLVPVAATYLDKLTDAQKGESFESLLLRARVLMKQGHPDAAAAIVNRLLPPRPVPKDQVWRLQTAAIEMDRLGLDTKAEELYREYMSYVPGNGTLQLASFLGRKGHIDEALDLCETSLKSEPAKSVLQAVAEVLHGQPKRVEPQHLQRVSKWYDRLLADNPGSTSLSLQHADFLILAGEDEKAERLFRDLLGHSDLTSTERGIAQNDLAFVLATQHKSLEEALRLVNEAGDLIGFKSDLLDTRGMVYLALGRHREAVKDFSEAVTVSNPSPAKFLHLAYANDLAKDRDQAHAALASAKAANLDSASLSKIEQTMYDQVNKDVGP